MRKRLTFEQKVEGVIRTLRDHHAHMTATQIAQEIGFVKGTAVRDILNGLVDAGWVETRPIKTNLRGGVMYRLRDECRDQVRDNPLVVLTGDC